MKVTKTANDFNDFRKMKEDANRGCSRCPCCGESKKSTYYIKNGITNKGIFSPYRRTRVKGSFKMKHMQVDCYVCKTCGAEWESEEYQYA